jgi:hypothetical protein
MGTFHSTPQKIVSEKIRKRVLKSYTIGSVSEASKSSSEYKAGIEILSDFDKFKEHYFDNYYDNKKNESLQAMKLKPWKVKVILTNLKTNGWLISFGAKIKKFDFGPVHAAVICGPYVLSWDDGELVIPERISEYRSDLTVASIDIGEIEGDKEPTIIKICEEAVRWNCEKNYRVMSTNCQCFVNELLKKLGYEDPLFRQTQEFLKRIQSNPLGFKYTFEWKGETIEFTSHQQLDQFYEQNQIGMEEGDHQLLKAYDRMFWFRFLALTDPQLENDADLKQNLSIDKSEISKYEGSIYCPFGDPRNPENGTLISWI